MTVVTIYALLGDDIKLLTTTKSADPIFTDLTAIALVLFLIEIIQHEEAIHLAFDLVYTWHRIQPSMPRVDMHTHMDSKTNYAKAVDSMDQWVKARPR